MMSMWWLVPIIPAVLFVGFIAGAICGKFIY